MMLSAGRLELHRRLQSSILGVKPWSRLRKTVWANLYNACVCLAQSLLHPAESQIFTLPPWRERDMHTGLVRKV